MTNALSKETSPYLLQHADNPVDWWPWSEGALNKAKELNKPIFLSIGYSACHWCHVMAHESFENAEIAAILNENFIPIKVDREERPDIDTIYMTSVQMLTGSGGWPLSVFLTPEGQPFYGGTYFPPEDRYGRPGFKRILLALTEMWQQNRERITSSAAEISNHLARIEHLPEGEIDIQVLDQAFDNLVKIFDEKWGGFASAPKFPNPGMLQFLLEYHHRNGQKAAKALEMVEITLRKMSQGGIYDHLGGGFSRYSTDERWLVPHFEKMLYDNAQLAEVYLSTFLVTQKESYAQIARETLDYVLCDMTSEEGAFFAAEDADSDGVEGKFYVWTLEEIEEILGDEAKSFADAYRVTKNGNWEGENILFKQKDGDFAQAKAKLLEIRNKRVRPGLDDKMIVAWNGLMVSSLAIAARIFDEPRYLEAAKRNVGLVKQKIWCNGRLFHTYKDGIAKIPGLLDDYALYTLGLIELYRTTFENQYLQFALELTETAIELFKDKSGFFDTPIDGEKLLIRPKSFFDAALPSGNGAFALVLQKLGKFFGRNDWLDLALNTIKPVIQVLSPQPTGFASLLRVLEGSLHTKELAIAINKTENEELINTINKIYLPHLPITAGLGDFPPLLAGKTLINGRTAAYICENFACQAPITDLNELQRQLLQKQNY